jgi:hypothetical protein
MATQTTGGNGSRGAARRPRAAAKPTRPARSRARSASPAARRGVPGLRVARVPGTGLSFRETMSGYFAFGHVDPQVGENVGRGTDWTMTMHAKVTIADVNAFVADPNHAGTLSGELIVPGIERRLPFSGGVFKLFVPSGLDRAKLMVYEAPFTHDGQQYYLAGRKTVRDDFGLDLWPDTTTLEVRLHEGPSTSAPVVGSGVLRLGVPELARLLASMRTQHAGSPVRSGRALGTFAWMFARNLRDTYLPRLSQPGKARRAA